MEKLDILYYRKQEFHLSGLGGIFGLDICTCHSSPPVREQLVSSKVKRLQTPLHDVSTSLWEEQCF